jgi:hypothetical protein
MADRIETARPRVVSGLGTPSYSRSVSDELRYRSAGVPPPIPAAAHGPTLDSIGSSPAEIGRAPSAGRTPVASGPPTGPPRGLFDLNGLLARAWSLDTAVNPGVSSATAARDTIPTGPDPASIGPAPAAPRPIEERAFVPPVTLRVPGPRAKLPTPPRPVTPSIAVSIANLANSGAAPRRTQAWLCSFCRLTNAPWTPACPSCRRVAP